MNEVMEMGIDGRLISNSIENPAVSLNDAASWEGGLTSERTSSGVRVNARTATGYPPLWRAMNLISGDVGRLPFNVYRSTKDGGKEIDKRHPAYRLLRRKVNPFVRSKTFKQTLTFHALRKGNGYSAIIRDGSGIARELLLLDPNATAPVQVLIQGRTEDEDRAELWYVTYIDNQPVKLPARDVLHIKGLSSDGIVGIDVLSIMADALGLGMGVRKWVSEFFGSGAMQSGLLMVPDTFGEDKLKALFKYWNEITTSVSKRHRTSLLRENVKWVATGTKPDEANADGILDHEIMTVSNITGVPPHKLGDKSRTSYNSLEIESQDYLDDCLDVWLVEWESECNEKLLSTLEQETESHFTEFNRNARLRMDSTARGAYYEKMWRMGVMTINDILRKESMATIGPMGDQRFVPLNFSTLTESGIAPKAAKSLRNTLRSMTMDVLNRKGEIERAKIERAAGKDGFGNWLETFYNDHESHVWKELRPLCRASEIVTGKRQAPRWRKAIRNHTTARREALAASPSITETLAGWSAAELCDHLLPKKATKGSKCLKS